MKMYYIVYLPEKLWLTGNYNKQFQCKSMFNGFTGPLRYSEKEAEADGEEHQKLLINAYPGLAKLVEKSWIRESQQVIEKEKRNTENTESKFNPPTVKIGDTEWMAENLAYDDGEGGIFVNSDNGEYYYTWEAAKRIAKKLGWRLPSDEDWNKACEACGGIKNKQGDYENCSLKKELNIKLAGLYFSSSFQGIGSRCYFWSVLDNSSCGAWSRLFDTSASVTRLSGIKLRGYSVRLIK